MPRPIPLPQGFLQPVKIARHTMVYGKEEDGHIPIYVREEPTENPDVKHMVTQWRPTDDQLAQLKSGASVFLSIVSQAEAAHPPIILAVVDILSAGENDNHG